MAGFEAPLGGWFWALSDNMRSERLRMQRFRDEYCAELAFLFSALGLAADSILDSIIIAANG